MSYCRPRELRFSEPERTVIRWYAEHATCIESVLPCQDYRRAVLRNYALGYWRLGEAPGSAYAYDDSEWQVVPPGTYGNVTGLGAPGVIAGDSNTAVDLSEPDDYVELPHDGRLSIGFDGSFGIELWVKLNTTGQLQKYFANLDNRWAVIYGYQPNTLEFFSGYSQGPCNPRDASAIPLAETGSWHHIVYTYDGTSKEWSGYKDGVQEFSVTCDFQLPEYDQPLIIGAAAAGTLNNVDAVIDEVAFYPW